MSDAHRQAFIAAPREVVWDLIADVEHHPEWWPGVIEVECEQVGEGCQYREVMKVPFGKGERNFLIEDFDDPARFHIRCTSTGGFVQLDLTDAQGGTFVEGRAGMDPMKLGFKVFDRVMGAGYFNRWLEESLDAIEKVATERAQTGPVA